MPKRKSAEERLAEAVQELGLVKAESILAALKAYNQEAFKAAKEQSRSARAEGYRGQPIKSKSSPSTTPRTSNLLPAGAEPVGG